MRGRGGQGPIQGLARNRVGEKEKNQLWATGGDRDRGSGRALPASGRERLNPRSRGVGQVGLGDEVRDDGDAGAEERRGGPIGEHKEVHPGAGVRGRGGGIWLDPNPGLAWEQVDYGKVARAGEGNTVGFEPGWLRSRHRSRPRAGAPEHPNEGQSNGLGNSHWALPMISHGAI